MISLQVGDCWFVEPDLPDPEILFSHVCNPGVLYTHSPCLGVQVSASKKGVRGWTHGIGLTIEFSHCISPIEESIVKRMSMVWYCIVLEERL